jgi:hypothetical protein
MLFVTYTMLAIRKMQMRTYSRRDLLKRASLAASAAVGASLACTPMLRTGGAIDEIFAAIRNGSPLTNDFATTSGRLTEWILTGHLAAFAGAGKKLQWDVNKL